MLARNAWILLPVVIAAAGSVPSQAQQVDGTELERRGPDLTDSLWSARLLADDPEAIRRLHADYLAAGADVNAEDCHLETPLDATQVRNDYTDPKKQDECAALLRKYGGRAGEGLEPEMKEVDSGKKP